MKISPEITNGRSSFMLENPGIKIRRMPGVNVLRGPAAPRDIISGYRKGLIVKNVLYRDTNLGEGIDVYA